MIVQEKQPSVKPALFFWKGGPHHLCSGHIPSSVLIPSPQHPTACTCKRTLNIYLLFTGFIINTGHKRRKDFQRPDNFLFNLTTFLYDNISSTGELAPEVANTNAETRELLFFLNDGQSHTSLLNQGPLPGSLQSRALYHSQAAQLSVFIKAFNAIVSWQFKWGQLVTRVTAWAIVCPLGTGAGRFK